MDGTIILLSFQLSPILLGISSNYFQFLPGPTTFVQGKIFSNVYIKSSVMIGKFPSLIKVTKISTLRVRSVVKRSD